MRSRLGVLRNTFSCSSMISDSTSLGAEARQLVLIRICGRLISGVISIGRRFRLMTPNIATRMQATATATGLPSDSRVNVIRSLPP